MNLIKNTIEIGIEKPFTFLHISDIHLAQTDENDSAERREFAAGRQRDFSYALGFMDEVREYVKKTGYPLFNTGDMLDFITPENLRITKEFEKETGMILVAGNHEYWHCAQNRFSFDDVPGTYEAKNQSLAEVQAHLENDIRFSCTEIGGVNLVCVDDTDYDIDEDIFEKLNAVEAEGKPIILFMHIPLYSEHLGGHAKYSLCAPEKYFENCHPVDVFERRPNELTCRIVEHIRQSELIRYVFSGHTHANDEILDKGEKNQIITGCNTIREITVK